MVVEVVEAIWDRGANPHFPVPPHALGGLHLCIPHPSLSMVLGML